MRNYTGVSVVSSTNHKTMDHTNNDQHIASMHSECAKARGSPLESYAPVVRSLVTLNDVAKYKRKFEMCYVLARENLVFVKYPAFHALSEHRGVLLVKWLTPSQAKAQMKVLSIAFGLVLTFLRRERGAIIR